MNQTPVKSGHLNSTGVFVLGRQRLKGVTTVGSGTAGVVHIFDDIAVATAITYGRSTTTITVAHTAHGYAVGATVGLAFTPAGGVSATNGNYKIVTVADANTYTVTDINSGTIAGGTGGFESKFWLFSLDTTTGSATTSIYLASDGILAVNGLTATMTNQTGTSIFYG